MAKPRTNDELFTMCPRRHKLPNRVKGRGRCTPDECCGAADGAHGAVKVAHQLTKQGAAETTAYAEETERLLDSRGRMAAWDEHHPLPKIATQLPERSPTSSVFQYLRERTAQAAPLALERIIRKALLVPGPAGDAAADNILDRMGFTRKGDAPVEFHGPVSIVNLDMSRIPLLAQKAQERVVAGEVQRITQGEEHGEQVSGVQKARRYLGSSPGDDAAGAGGRVREDGEEEPERRPRPEEGDSEG